jgi:hypothetical protein
MAGEEFIIGFFGGVSTLIWAELAIKALDKKKETVGELTEISRQILASLAYFGVAALCYYGSIQPTQFLTNISAYVAFIEGAAFICGLFSLIVGCLALQNRETGRKRRWRLPPLITLFFLGLVAITNIHALTFNGPILSGGMGGFGFVNRLAYDLFVLSFIGLPLFFLAFKRNNRKALWVSRIGVFLLTLPWLFLFVIIGLILTIFPAIASWA